LEFRFQSAATSFQARGIEAPAASVLTYRTSPGQAVRRGLAVAELQAALKDGMADGQKEIDARRASLGARCSARATT
jgi:predicted deacylase